MKIDIFYLYFLFRYNFNKMIEIDGYFSLLITLMKKMIDQHCYKEKRDISKILMNLFTNRRAIFKKSYRLEWQLLFCML